MLWLVVLFILVHRHTYDLQEAQGQRQNTNLRDVLVKAKLPEHKTTRNAQRGANVTYKSKANAKTATIV